MDVTTPAPLSTTPPRPPWLADDSFPTAPVEPYGYRRLKQLVPCSFAELDTALRNDLNRQITLVWTPLQPRLIPPEEVPFLEDALAEGERRRAWQGLRIGAIQLVIWGFLLFLSSQSRNAGIPTYLLYLLSFGLIPLVQQGWTLWQLQTGRWAPPEPVSGRFRAWMAGQQERWSVVLLGCLTLVGGAQLLNAMANFLDREASSILAAGLVKPAVWSGELWRLMTGPLLHGNPVHFIFNAIALLVLGGLVEVLVSREAMAVTFVLSALTGSLFSLFLLAAPSVGASGGIMGLLGVAIVLAHRRRGQVPRPVLRGMLTAAALIAVTGLVAFDVVDNAAHLGGFLAGLGLGWLLIPSHGPVPTGTVVSLRLAGWCALVAVVLFSLVAILAIMQVLPATSR